MKLSTKAQKSLDKVIAKFEGGDLSPVVNIARIRRNGKVPFDSWSFCNRIMTYIQSGGSTDLRGYRQWQEVGRQVQGGSLASFILVPRFAKVKKDDSEEKESRLVGFMTVAVFAYEQTDGEPLPEHDYNPIELPPLVDVAEGLCIQVSWKPLPPDRLGDCTITGDKINVGSHDVSVFFHELAHAAHANVNGGKLNGGQDKNQETIAEVVACTLAELYGYEDYTGNVWQYISRLHKDPLRAIMRAMAEVEKVLNLLLDGEGQS